MKIVISTILLLLISASIQAYTFKVFIKPEPNVVLYDGKDTFVSVAQYSVFAISAGMILVGELKDKPNLTKVFVPVMSLAVGFYFGQKF